MDHGLVKVTGSRGVSTLTMTNLGSQNAITPSMMRSLQEQCHRAIDQFPDDRVIIITGEGEDFSSGTGSWPPPGTPYPGAALARQTASVCSLIREMPQPAIAKLRGVCSGLAATIALACDLVVADPTVRLTHLDAARAIRGGNGDEPGLLRTLVGARRSVEMAMLDEITAEDGLRIGVINRVVGVADLDGFTDEWAAVLASRPHQETSDAKSLLNTSFSEGHEPTI